MDVEESLAEAADIAAFIGHTRDVGSSNEENIVDLETNLWGEFEEAERLLRRCVLCHVARCIPSVGFVQWKSILAK